MKYVRLKSGDIDLMEDRDSIPAGAETIFSTDPTVYEGTWDKPGSGLGRVDVEMAGGKERIVKPLPGDAERDTSYVGTAKERRDKGYDPEGDLYRDGKATGWTPPHKAHPKDKVCLNCGKPMPGVRPNRKFCSEKCRNTYGKRIRRKEARNMRDFKPHMGKEGQIYYMYEGKIGFIPALWCDNRKRTESYIKANYPPEVGKVVLEQVKEVMEG